MLIKVTLLLIFFAITISIGLVCRKRATSVSQFVLGGRNIGAWLTAFAFGTTYFSAVIFVGYAGQFGWKFGLSATWIGIGNAFIGSLAAWLLLGRRTRIMTQHLGSATMPDFFEKRYESKSLKLAASAVLFIFMIPYTASLYNGLSRIFGMAFNIDYSICIVAMAVLTAVYVIAGGYLAASMNDFVQGIIMLVGIVAIIAAVLNNHGGLSQAVESMSKVQDPTVEGRGVFASLFGPDPKGLISVVLLTSLGTWGLPQMVHKFYAIKNEKSIKRGTVISTVFATVIAGGCYFLGSFSRIFDTTAFTDETGAVIFDAIIPSVISRLPDILVGIAVILVLSASMSTLASLVLTSSSTLTLDFIKGTLVKDMDGKKQILTIRILLAFFILVSAVIALIQYNSRVTFIAQLMGISWGALAGSFLGPFLYGLYWKRTTRASVWVSFAVAVCITVTNMFFNYFPTPIYAGVTAMLASLVLVPLVSLLTKKPDQDRVNQIFSCYHNRTETKINS
ncbi:MAG: sodium:solute symporter [Clostridiales bacterium]|jgi:SSS family solute:Na+ symporter|nr:sodium:solute symporter [Clostridiales bacterium]